MDKLLGGQIVVILKQYFGLLLWNNKKTESRVYPLSRGLQTVRYNWLNFYVMLDQVFTHFLSVSLPRPTTASE